MGHIISLNHIFKQKRAIIFFHKRNQRFFGGIGGILPAVRVFQFSLIDEIHDR